MILPTMIRLEPGLYGVTAQAAYLAAAKVAAKVEPLRHDVVFHHPITEESCFRPGESKFARLRTIDGVGTGVSQFSIAGLAEIKELLEAKQPGVRLLVLDLREESHFFDVRGEPRHAHGFKNWGNVGQSFQAIVSDELWRAERARGITEAEACARAGLGYLRIPITDHAKPRDGQVDQLVELVESLGPSDHLVAHCLAGKGRTTTVLAMIDILRNGDRMTLEQIVERQHRAGGIDLFEEPLHTDYKRSLSIDRTDLLRRFYDYAKYWRRAPREARLSFGEWGTRAQRRRLL